MAASSWSTAPDPPAGDRITATGVRHAGAVTAQRSAGGRRLFTRRQLAFAARVRQLLDQGHTLAAARRILALEDDLAAERTLTARLHPRPGEPDASDR